MVRYYALYSNAHRGSQRKHAKALVPLSAALCIYPTFVGRRQIPHEIWLMLLIALVYFGGSSLVSAPSRFMLPITPICFLWIAFVLTRIVKIRLLA